MDNQGTGQTARMRRLVCAFVIRNLPEDRFSRLVADIMFLEQKEKETNIQITLKWTHLVDTIYCASVRVPFKGIQSGNAHTHKRLDHNIIFFHRLILISGAN